MKSHLNLLPYSMQRRQVAACWLRRWLALWLLAGTVAALVGGRLWYADRLAQTRRDAFEKDYQPVKEAVREIKSLRAEIARLQEREAMSLALCDEQPTLSIMGLVSRAAADCQAGVYVEQLELKRSAASPARGKTVGNTPASYGLLALRGVGQDNVAIARFAANLRDSGVFFRVELKSTGTKQMATGEFRTYNIECLF